MIIKTYGRLFWVVFRCHKDERETLRIRQIHLDALPNLFYSSDVGGTKGRLFTDSFRISNSKTRSPIFALSRFSRSSLGAYSTRGFDRRAFSAPERYFSLQSSTPKSSKCLQNDNWKQCTDLYHSFLANLPKRHNITMRQILRKRPRWQHEHHHF